MNLLKLIKFNLPQTCLFVDQNLHLPHLPRLSLQYLEIPKFGKIPDCNTNNMYILLNSNLIITC
jgi:hypothetical protein